MKRLNYTNMHTEPRIQLKLAVLMERLLTITSMTLRSSST